MIDPFELAAGELAVYGLFLLPLLLAGGWDVATYRIPNAISLASLALFAAAAAFSGRPVAWGAHFGAGGLVLLLGFPMFAARLLGGGDVKLLAATSVWFGLGNLLSFLVLTAVAGGALAVAALFARSHLAPVLLARFGRVPAVLVDGAAVPYAAAIALGGFGAARLLPLLSPA